MNEGFVKLWRKTKDSRVFRNEGLLKVWVWCLMKASHKKRWVSMKSGKGEIEIEIFPGQFVFGRNSAGKELRMKPETVRTRMAKLKKMQNLTIEPTRQYSIVSIINWDTYQSLEKKDTIKNTNRTPTGHQPDTTDKNVKTVNKEIYSRVVDYLNAKTGKLFKASSKKTQSLINSRLNDKFKPEDFKTVIDNKVSDYQAGKFEFKFLRPETLFGSKFESYLNESATPLNGSSKPGILTKEQITSQNEDFLS